MREASSIVQRPRWFRGIVSYVGKEDDPVRELVCGAELESFEEDDEGGENGNTRKKRPLLLLKRKKQVRYDVCYPICSICFVCIFTANFVVHRLVSV